MPWAIGGPDWIGSRDRPFSDFGVQKKRHCLERGERVVGFEFNLEIGTSLFMLAS